VRWNTKELDDLTARFATEHPARYLDLRRPGQAAWANRIHKSPARAATEALLRKRGPWPQLIAAGRFLMSGFPTVAFAAVVMSSHAMAHPVVPTEQKFNVGMWPSRQ
jgi:hypothetical protein